MKGVALLQNPVLDILSAYSAPQREIGSVEETPGWNVVGAFFMPTTANIRLELVGLVSDTGLTMRTRLFDLVANEPVAGTEASLNTTTDTRALSPVFELTGVRTYQIQVEITGSDDGFGVVRSASPTV